ncbi:MAG: DUF5106 domain-containing protein [Bacteroidales bacterium]|nr:DUF5106 domain-containing protein [Bacteroidales bacterium]
MRHFVFVALALLLFSFSQAKDSLYLKIRIKGFADSRLLLTSYHGDKVKLIDTAFVTKAGFFIFKREENLPGGIYMAVSPEKKKLFEFILDKNQHFTLTTDTANYTLNMKIKGSDENRIFYDYMRFNEKQFQENKLLKEKLDSLPKNNEAYILLTNQLDSINQLLVEYKLKVIRENPDLFVAKLFSAMREVEIPDSVLQSEDSTLPFKYLKQHYWDYFDLSDTRLLRTPLLSSRVTQYFDQLVVIQPDSVIAAIDEVIRKARPSEEVVGFLVWHFVSAYQNPKYMGFEKVFIHLVDEYFSREAIIYTTPSVLESLQERAEILRPLQLGKPAPNLLLIDTNNVFRSFMEINNDFTVLLFWDYDCSFCKKEIKFLQEIYEKTDFDFEVYAINTNGDHDKWKETVSERRLQWINVNGTLSQTPDFHDLYDVHGSPVIYLLDKQKRIIAKQIGADQIIPFLENYSKTEHLN